MNPGCIAAPSFLPLCLVPLSMHVLQPSLSWLLLPWPMDPPLLGFLAASYFHDYLSRLYCHQLVCIA